MEKFGLSMQESKKIVDFISEEIYEKEQEEMQKRKKLVDRNNNTKKAIKKSINILSTVILIFLQIALLFLTAFFVHKQSKFGIVFLIAFFVVLIINIKRIYPKSPPNVYKFSFFKYFMHNLIYKIIVIVVMCIIPIKFEKQIMEYGDSRPIILLCWYAIVVIVSIVFLYKWLVQISTIIIVEDTELIFEQERINLELSKHEIETYIGDYKHVVRYCITNISKVKEHFNSIVIYGDIVKSDTAETPRGTTNYEYAKYNKIRISKYFKNESNLMDDIRSLKERMDKKEK